MYKATCLHCKKEVTVMKCPVCSEHLGLHKLNEIVKCPNCDNLLRYDIIQETLTIVPPLSNRSKQMFLKLYQNLDIAPENLTFYEFISDFSDTYEYSIKLDGTILKEGFCMAELLKEYIRLVEKQTKEIISTEIYELLLDFVEFVEAVLNVCKNNDIDDLEEATERYEPEIEIIPVKEKI